MGIEDTFNGARVGYAMLNAYFIAISRAIGSEQATGLLSKTFENVALMQAKKVKEQAGNITFDAKTAWPVIRLSGDVMGVDLRAIEETPQKVVFTCGRCPIYEAGQLVGMDNKAIENICRAGGEKFDDTVAKQLNPNLSVRLSKFRSSADDFCEEEIMLK